MEVSTDIVNKQSGTPQCSLIPCYYGLRPYTGHGQTECNPYSWHFASNSNIRFDEQRRYAGLEKTNCFETGQLATSWSRSSYITSECALFAGLRWHYHCKGHMWRHTSSEIQGPVIGIAGRYRPMCVCVTYGCSRMTNIWFEYRKSSFPPMSFRSSISFLFAYFRL